MDKLVNLIKNVWWEATPLVESRWEEFVEVGKNGSEKELFSELSFCVLTANWSAKRGIFAQGKIGDGFYTFPQEKLEKTLKEVGHRFPSARARYIVENRWIVGKLKELIVSAPPKEVREYIVENVKGIGWKESSHFLRNIGIGDFAILDKHIMRLMKTSEIIDEIPKSWTKSRYLDYESRLIPVAEYFNLPLGKLDLYMWYLIKNSVDK